MAKKDCNRIFTQYLKLALFFIILFLIILFIVHALEISILTDPAEFVSKNIAVSLLVSYLLLAGDVILPIPSSILMTLNGALFGMIPGTIVSLSGCITSGLISFVIGKKSQPWMNKLLTTDEQEKALCLIDKWGMLSIIASRPFPIIAETVTICAGASGLRFDKFMFAVIIGSVPISLVYAIAGAMTTNIKAGIIIFIIILLLSGVFWFTGKNMGGKK